MRLGMMLAAVAMPLAAMAAAPAISPAITRALADPVRSDQAGDDARRHAAAAVAFSGVKPGWRVVDLIPGGGYWTRIFAGVVGPAGHVDALFPAGFNPRSQTRVDSINALKLANTTAAVDPATITLDRPADLVWTVQNYHDLPNDGRGEANIAAVNAAVFKALKPGGTYVVIDHAAAAGSGLRDTATLHRIDPAIVRQQATTAGFTFAGQSTVVANPQDDHTLAVFDPKVRGATDQFVLKFRKPLK